MTKNNINKFGMNNNYRESNIVIEFYLNTENNSEELELSRFLIASFFAQENINCIESSKGHLIFKETIDKYLNVFIALSDLRYDEIIVRNLKEAYIFFYEKEDLLNNFLRKDSPYQFSLPEIMM